MSVIPALLFKVLSFPVLHPGSWFTFLFPLLETESAFGAQNPFKKVRRHKRDLHVSPDAPLPNALVDERA